LTEKEKESKDWFQSIKENYERSMIERSEEVIKVQDECKAIEEELERTKDKNHHYALTIALRLLRTQLWVAAESRVALSQDYMLAIKARQLQDKIDGLKPSLSLEETAKQLENEIRKITDEQLAKRIGQLSAGNKGGDRYIG
jgi:hypothetical protein